MVGILSSFSFVSVVDSVLSFPNSSTTHLSSDSSIDLSASGIGSNFVAKGDVS